MRQSKIIALLTLLFLSVFVLPSCKSGYEDTFKISLVETGEIVLTGNDIAAYDAENYSLELNESGINKWNSYQIDDTNPRSRNILFEKEFIISIDGQEICQGKFWAAYSNYFLPEVYKIVSLDRLNNEFNELWLGMDGLSETAAIYSALGNHFKKIGRLK